MDDLVVRLAADTWLAGLLPFTQFHGLTIYHWQAMVQLRCLEWWLERWYWPHRTQGEDGTRVGHWHWVRCVPVEAASGPAAKRLYTVSDWLPICGLTSAPVTRWYSGCASASPVGCYPVTSFTYCCPISLISPENWPETHSTQVFEPSSPNPFECCGGWWCALLGIVRLE